MFSRLKSIPLMLTIWLALVILLSACSSGVESQPEVEQSNERSSESQLESTDVPVIPTLTTGGLPEPTAEVAGDEPELGFALGDPNLRATNPDTVVLASGQIQLIEFFAFW